MGVNSTYAIVSNTSRITSLYRPPKVARHQILRATISSFLSQLMAFVSSFLNRVLSKLTLSRTTLLISNMYSGLS